MRGNSLHCIISKPFLAATNATPVNSPDHHFFIIILCPGTKWLLFLD